MDKKELRKYAKLQAKIKELEGQRDALKVDILHDMSKESIEKAETDFGIFTRAHRTTWEYSDKVENLKQKVKIQETKEQNEGTANPITNEYLRYTI